MKPFKLSTKKSLFDPIRIDIEMPDGSVKTFVIERVTPDVLEKVSTFEEQATKGDMKGVMGQLVHLTGIPQKVLVQLDVRDIEQLLKYVSERIFEPMKFAGGEEKNGSKVEDAPSPQ